MLRQLTFNIGQYIAAIAGVQLLIEAAQGNAEYIAVM